MYYYILESPQSRGIRQSYQRLRDILTNLSIVGEIVAASPARTPSELTEMGISKGYSTVVAVGGDHHVNEVATAIIAAGKGGGIGDRSITQAVLGVIPVGASSLVTDIIGVSDLKDAAEALKHRRLTLQSTVLVEPNTTIFLDTAITSSRLSKISMVLDNRVRAHAYFNQMIVNRFLQIRLESMHTTEARKVLGLFTVGGETIKSESLFRARHARIITDPILPLTVAGIPITQTPIQLRLVHDSLKVISKRGTVFE